MRNKLHQHQLAPSILMDISYYAGVLSMYVFSLVCVTLAVPELDRTSRIYHTPVGQ